MKLTIVVSILIMICVSIGILYSPEEPQPEPTPPPYVYSDFEPGFGIYIVNSVRITYDELSDTQHLICIDNQPVKIHGTEHAAKAQMERLLKYYRGEY